MTETEKASPFAGWAVLELMGHRRLGGWVEETTLAGAGFIRIDSPAVPGAEAFTQLYSPGSVYCLTPTTEAVARAAAGGARVRPVERWELERAVVDVEILEPEEELTACPECRRPHEGPDDLCPECLDRPEVADLLGNLEASLSAAHAEADDSRRRCSLCKTAFAEVGADLCQPCSVPF